ncbi:MAG: gfo/Idh/MocA family oxidoreductase [Balneola sp.]|nr:MAG: gfo/Idh/MocA family oxidoreductase [Balneola sp.]
MNQVGILGFGKMGQIRAETIENTKKAVVKSVYEYSDQIKIEDYNKVESPDEIFSDTEIDIIFVCTPNFLNKEYTIKGLEAGKHVFCEKPPAFTADDVQEIIEVEKRTGKKLMYGFNHRHHSSIKHMKGLIKSNEYGKILWMRGRYGKSVDESFFKGWRAKRELAGGGIFIDQGIHMLDLFLHFAKDFDEIHAIVSDLYWGLDIEDNVFAMFKNTETGIAASLHSTMTQWRHLFSIEVFLEKGYMVLNGLKTSSGTYGDEVLSIAKNRSTAPAATWEDEERITFHTNSSWRSEIDHFMECITEDKAVSVGSSNDALKLMKIIDKVYENAK